ncbi:MAG: hypothetical protein WD355_10205 [Balneolaceae bacterium]
MKVRYRSVFWGVLTLLLPFLLTDTLYAQIQEPEVVEIESARTPLSEGYKSGIGFNTVINNFGFGVGVEFRRVLSSRLEGFGTLRLTGLRDVREQTFTDIFFGQQTIPNKYQRAFAFPLTFGVRQRLFADRVQDDFRFYASLAAGPVLTYSYPYFNDSNENGFRENDEIYRWFGYFEETNDVFTGMGSGDWHLGLAGEFKISLDVGDNFSRLTSIQFGYLFYYFNDGVQMMQPNQPVTRRPTTEDPIPFERRPEGCGPLGSDCELVTETFFSPQTFFGTPQISLVFGRMW